MSRKSIFWLAVVVVFMYFSIILFMLNPLHEVKSSYYRNSYASHLGFRRGPIVRWCKELKWLSPSSSNIVALVSYPGSGNTWLRYLLQQVTGIVTGSIYMDYGLRLHGFPAENVTDSSVLVVKTHEGPPKEKNKFKSAIILIRNPRDAILADFNRLHKGHIGTAPKSAFHKRSHDQQKPDWFRYVSSQLGVWESLHTLWLTRFPGPIHIVLYEVLVNDTRTTLQGILSFLNYTVAEEDMSCALSNKEGIYRRRNKHTDFDPYTPEMYRSLERVYRRVMGTVMRFHKNGTERRQPPATGSDVERSRTLVS